MGAATTTLTAGEFDSTVSEHDLVVVDFWASWCGPCRSFAPVFEAAAADHPDVLFAKVDTEAEQELAARFDVRSIPTVMVVREQVVLYARPGALPRHALDDLLAQAKALDMDEVRAAIAAEQAGGSPA